jgi:ribose 5-phosphate isomerase B
MRIALGSDLAGELAAALEHELERRGHEVRRYGALEPSAPSDWPSVGRAVGEAVSKGACDLGIVCCWTGTGVCMAANKVRGVRAALCADAQTARGARVWNDANVLALSIRLTTPALASEILDAWFGAQPPAEGEDRAMIDALE